MKHWMGNMLILTLWLECSGEDTVTQSTGEVIGTEGHTVTLDCTFEISSSINAYLFWYKQEVNNQLMYILRRDTLNTEDNSPEFQKDRFDATINKTSVPLKISSAAVSDSAVYYCAVRPAGTKIIFGTGTSLTIEPKTVSEPSFYKLSGDGTSACLASDFSRKKAAEEQHAIFSRSAAVLVEEVSLYNQLVLLTSEGEEEACEQAEDDSDVCGEPVEPDGRVNLMSVTMLGLRLLFFKTVVFNVLMTLRLWISQ